MCGLFLACGLGCCLEVCVAGAVDVRCEIEERSVELCFGWAVVVVVGVSCGCGVGQAVKSFVDGV